MVRDIFFDQQDGYMLALTEDRFVTTIHVTGGGKSGQLDDIVHGISRALNLMNTEEYRPTLKAKGLLTRDPRTRERRMVGTGGKSRRAKQSPKR
jgi:small subunit ribosomal protein S9